MRAQTVALALLGGLAGCSNDFAPRSVLQDLRVLAIQATPLDLQPITGAAGQVPVIEPIALAAVEYIPASVTVDPADRHWSFCPFSIGSTVGYACIDPRCEIPLAPSRPDGSAVAVSDPGALLAACLATVGGSGGDNGVSAGIPDVIDFIFRYQVTGLDQAGNPSSREVIEPVPFYLRGVPLPRNLPPEFDASAGVSIGGRRFDVTPYGQPVDTGLVLEPGSELDIATPLTPDSAQPYLDDLGQVQTETLIVSYYTTNGRFDYDRANGPDARVTLKYESVLAGVPASIYAVARDLRGGQTVIGPYLVGVPSVATALPAGNN